MKVSFQILSDKSPIEKMTKLTGEDLVIFGVPGGCGNEVTSRMMYRWERRMFIRDSGSWTNS